MVIFQIKFTDVSEEEQILIPDFIQELASVYITKLRTKINRKKIKLRLNYIKEEADWMNWLPNLKYNTSVDDIIEAISKSFTVKQYKDNTWKLEASSAILIPNSITPIARFMRFFNYGDSKYHATGFFTNMISELHGSKINLYWNLYLRNVGINRYGRLFNNFLK